MAERETLTKIPASGVRPRQDKLVDGLSLFRTTGETILMAARERTDPVWVCGECESPLAVGMEPARLLGRVMRCGKCRSYNRVELV